MACLSHQGRGRSLGPWTCRVVARRRAALRDHRRVAHREPETGSPPQRVIALLYRILEDTCPDDHEVFSAPHDWQPDRRTSLRPDLLVVAKDRIGEKNITEPHARRRGAVPQLVPLRQQSEVSQIRGDPYPAVLDRRPADRRKAPAVGRGLRPGRGRVLPADCRSEGDREISVTAPIPVTVSASALFGR